MAAPDSPRVAACPSCGGVVTKRKRQKLDGQTTYFYGHKRGVGQGLLRSEIEERYPELFRWWLTTPWSVTPPAGESLEQVQARVNAALDDIVRRHPEECVGLVAHRIPIALIKVRYRREDPDIVRTLDLPNAYWEEIRDLDS